MVKKKHTKQQHSNSAKSKPKGECPTNLNVVGLTNDGVHCYMNATVQALARVPGLVGSLKSWCFSTLQLVEKKMVAVGTVNSSNGLSVFTNLVDELLSCKNSAINPKKFRSHFFSNAYMESHLMQDASEFLSCFLDIVEREEAARFRIEDNVKLPNVRKSVMAWSSNVNNCQLAYASCNPVSATLIGHQLMMYRCEKCLSVTANVDRFYILSLGLHAVNPYKSSSHTTSRVSAVPHSKRVSKSQATVTSPSAKSCESDSNKNQNAQQHKVDDNSESEKKLPINSQAVPPAPSVPLSKKQAKRMERENNKKSRRLKHAMNKKQRQSTVKSEEDDQKDEEPVAISDNSEVKDISDPNMESIDIMNTAFLHSGCENSTLELCPEDSLQLGNDVLLQSSSITNENHKDGNNSSVEDINGSPCNTSSSTQPINVDKVQLFEDDLNNNISIENCRGNDHGDVDKIQSVTTKNHICDDSLEWLDFYTPVNTSQEGKRDAVPPSSLEHEDNIFSTQVREWKSVQQVEDEEDILCSLFDDKCNVDDGIATSSNKHISTPHVSPPPSPVPLPIDVGSVKVWPISSCKFPDLPDSGSLPYLFDLDASESVRECSKSSISSPENSSKNASFLNLQELLLGSFYTENIDGSVECERCHGEKTSRSYRHVIYAKPPSLLTLQLKRFLPKNPSMPYVKDSTPVHFEDFIYVPVLTPDGLNFASEYYSLHSVICHIGSNMNSGHYVCFVRLSSLNGKDNIDEPIWVEFNDEYCRKVTWNRVQDSCPYMFLFHHAKKN